MLLGGRYLLGCGDDDAAPAATTATPGSAPANSAAAGTLTDVNLQLSWLDSVQFAGSYIADENGYYEAEGLSATLTPGGPNAPVDPPVLQGQALMGISAADYAGRSFAEGAPFKIVAVAMQKNPFVIASLAEAPITEPGQMVGKRLGMATINQVVLEAIAKFNDFDASDVEVVPYQYDPAPLVNGEVDCIMCWLTDLPVAMTVAGVENTTMLLADFGYTVHSQTYIVTDDSMANRRDDVLALLRGEIRGWQTYREDTAAAAALTVERFPDAGLDLAAQELQAEEQLQLFFSEDTDANGLLWFTDESVELNISTLAELDVTVTADLWDRSLLEEIFADGPTI